MKTILLASAMALTMPMAAMAQTSGSMSDPTTSPPATSSSPSSTMMTPPSGTSGSTGQMTAVSPAPGATTLSAQDKKFIKMAAIGGLAEVTDGQLAEQMGDASVKQIGTRMVTDHTKANDQLTALSKQLGDPAPAQTDSKHIAMTAALQKDTGTSFDTAYLQEQLTAHEKTIALFKKEISKGSNPALKSFAQTTLPVLEQHLSMIKSAEQS